MKAACIEGMAANTLELLLYMPSKSFIPKKESNRAKPPVFPGVAAIKLKPC